MNKGTRPILMIDLDGNYRCFSLIYKEYQNPSLNDYKLPKHVKVPKPVGWLEKSNYLKDLMHIRSFAAVHTRSALRLIMDAYASHWTLMKPMI